MLAGAMTAGVLTVFLSYLARFFKPVQDLAKMTNSIAQTAVAAERIQSILETDEVIPERPERPRSRRSCAAKSRSIMWRSAMIPRLRCCAT